MAGDPEEEAAEARNPALHNAQHYFAGGVEEAIAVCRANRGFLCVFLKGGDRESYLADETLHVSLGWRPLNCVTLRLHDDLSNSDPTAYFKAKAFRQAIHPTAVRQLPFLMLLAPSGQQLVSLQGAEVAKGAAGALATAAAQFPLPQAAAQPAAVPQDAAAGPTAAPTGGLGEVELQSLGQALLLVSRQAAQARQAGGSSQPAAPSPAAAAAAAAPAPQPRQSSGPPAAQPATGSAATPAPAAAALREQTIAAAATGPEPAAAQPSQADSASAQRTSAGLLRGRAEAPPQRSDSGAQAAQPDPARQPADQPASQPAEQQPAQQPAKQSPAKQPAQQQPAKQLAKQPTTEQLPASQPAERSAAAAAATAEIAPEPPATASLAIRLLDGTLLRREFAAKAKLGEVLRFIDAARTDSSRPYLLKTGFPPRSLGASLAGASLASLDLCSRSLLTLQPAGPATAAAAASAPAPHAASRSTGEGPGLLARLSAWLLAAMTAIASFLAAIVRKPAPPAAGGLRPAAPAGVPENKGSEGPGTGSALRRRAAARAGEQPRRFGRMTELRDD